MALFWGTVDKAKLDPAFLADAQQLLEQSTWDWWVLSGYRSPAQQHLLWVKYQAGGPRAAPAGRSAHNYGLAIDVAPDLDSNPANGLQPNWVVSSAPYVWLKATTIPNPRLRSGWSFSDYGHIERVNWSLDIPAAQRALAAA